MAVRSPTIAFVGRVLFAFLFISSGFQKLTSFNLQNGGPVMSGMAPKMDNFIKTLDRVAGVQLPISQVEPVRGRSGSGDIPQHVSHMLFRVTMCTC